MTGPFSSSRIQPGTLQGLPSGCEYHTKKTVRILSAQVTRGNVSITPSYPGGVGVISFSASLNWITNSWRSSLPWLTIGELMYRAAGFEADQFAIVHAL
jgi:hypothetical protein